MSMTTYSNMTLSSLLWRYLNRLVILTISLIVNSWATTEFIPYQKNMTAQELLSIDQLKISFVKASESVMHPAEDRTYVGTRKVQEKRLMTLPATAEKPNKALPSFLLDERPLFVKNDTKTPRSLELIEDVESENEGSPISPELVNTSVEPRNPLMSRPAFLTPPKGPRYPTLARKRGQEGTVWLEIWLNKFGEQTKRIITESSGVNVLDSAALATVSQWEFMPHRQADVTIASRVKIPIEFVLN
ncbi:MAG: TonB family protein [Oleiphilaceae bacterium]|jgi:TonB family protein